MSVSDNIEHKEWEICLLICPKKHEKKMSIMVDMEIRNTYCARCNKSTYWKRKENKVAVSIEE